MKRYDFLIVGAGLFGSTCAYELSKRGYSVLVIDKRRHIGGNCFTKEIDGINVHFYGAHIFHTEKKEIWDYIKNFATFNSFINSPVANYKGEIYHLPFNMNTFCEMWNDVKTPEDAKRHIEEEKKNFYSKNPTNLEEQAINLIGKTIYNKLIKEYTEKQWGRDCKLLPPFIIKRLPVRFTFDNNYFTDPYQGIPIGGYTQIFDLMLKKCDVVLNEDFLEKKEHYLSICNKVIYTGAIDEYFNFVCGELEYRSLKFKIKRLNIPSYQNNAVVNYTSHEVPYTRIIEHKFFEFLESSNSVISLEYPLKYEKGMIQYYTVNDEKNSLIYEKYFELSKKEKNVYFGGRLGAYKYFDMDDTIFEALKLVERIINE